MLREIARRTGEVDVLAKAAATFARLSRQDDEAVAAAAKLEQAACARLSAELFADDAAFAAAEAFLDASENGRAGVSLAVRRRAMRAAVTASAALAAGDLDRALEAASGLDAAVIALDEGVARTGTGRAEAAALHCDRADFLVGFGARFKDRALLARAEADLTALTRRLDPDRLPLSWSRAQALRGAALAWLGDLNGEAANLAEAVRALTAAAEVVDVAHSPFDRARISHTLGLALSALAHAAEDEGVFDHALAAFDQAAAAIGQNRALALRTVIAHDRAACVAEQAERCGDAAALSRAEASFRAELSAQNAAADPAAWAVAQLAITRVYIAQANLLGGLPAPAQASVALTEALEVFLERGLKSLAESAQETLAQLRATEVDEI
jgi:hypothetical protein